MPQGSVPCPLLRHWVQSQGAFWVIRAPPPQMLNCCPASHPRRCLHRKRSPSLKLGLFFGSSQCWQLQRPHWDVSEGPRQPQSSWPVSFVVTGDQLCCHRSLAFTMAQPASFTPLWEGDAKSTLLLVSPRKSPACSSPFQSPLPGELYLRPHVIHIMASTPTGNPVARLFCSAPDLCGQVFPVQTV